MSNLLEDLIFNWQDELSLDFKSVAIHDETLRDGLQSCSIKIPSFQDKCKILTSLDAMNIKSSCLGYPASSLSEYYEIEKLLKHTMKNKLKIYPTMCARTLVEDIEPIVRLSQKHGVEIEAMIFIGSSSMRKHVENWSMNHICSLAKESIHYSKINNLKVTFVTEDTTRAKPEDIKTLYEIAIEYGVDSICICDTVGIATPSSTQNLVEFSKEIVKKSKREVLIDWHGHNDRGLALINALIAMKAGVNRVHSTVLGIGERAGNVSLEEILINMKLFGNNDIDIKKINELCKLVSQSINMPIDTHRPVVGKNVFSTSSGTHASAILKAYNNKLEELADIIYCAYSPKEVGRETEILIGPKSGRANIIYLLKKMGLPVLQEDIDRILEMIKNDNITIDEKQLFYMIRNIRNK